VAARGARTLPRRHGEPRPRASAVRPGRVQGPHGPRRRCGDVDGIARARASGGVGLGARRDSEQTQGILVGRSEGQRRGWGRGVGRGVGGGGQGYAGQLVFLFNTRICWAVRVTPALAGLGVGAAAATAGGMGAVRRCGLGGFDGSAGIPGRFAEGASFETVDSNFRWIGLSGCRDRGLSAPLGNHKEARSHWN
jgi:hypothetical protein